MILRAPHAEFEIKAAALWRGEYEPGCLELRLGAAADLGGNAAIVVYGDPGEPESALEAALAEELCRIWCRDVWGWTDQAGALDQEGGIWTGQQADEICSALRACRTVKAIGRGDPAFASYFTEAAHEFRDPLVPAKRRSDEDEAADQTRMLIWNADGIFERSPPEQWGPQYQPLDADDVVPDPSWPPRGLVPHGIVRSAHPWLLAELPHTYDENELLHIEKWIKARDPLGVLT